MKEMSDLSDSEKVAGGIAQSQKADSAGRAEIAIDAANGGDHSDLRKSVFELLADEEGVFDDALDEMLASDSLDLDPVPMLIPIRATGSKPPIFSVHPAGGQVMVYQHVSNLLGLDQPFYGLQSRALDNSSLEYRSIEEMAREYTDVICRQQAEGPYHLLGWSMGGVIAVSVAQRLEEQGRQVAFVGLVDSYLFDDSFDEEDLLGGLALAFGGALGSAFDSLDAHSQEAIRSELLALPAQQRVRRVIEWGRERKLLPANLSTEIFEEQVKLSAVHNEMMRGHRAPTIQAPLNVWWATGNTAARTDWRKHTLGEFNAEALTGNHFTLLYPPHCYALAKRIEARLELAHQSPRQI